MVRIIGILIVAVLLAGCGETSKNSPGPRCRSGEVWNAAQGRCGPSGEYTLTPAEQCTNSGRIWQNGLCVDREQTVGDGGQPTTAPTGDEAIFSGMDDLLSSVRGNGPTRDLNTRTPITGGVQPPAEETTEQQ